MENVLLCKGSFFTISFREGIICSTIEPNVRVTEPMFLEFYESWKHINRTIQTPAPSLVLISGIISMNRDSRELARSIRNTGIVYASALMANNVVWFAMLRLLVSIVGSESLPREFFTDKEKAFQWLEKTRRELGMRKLELTEFKNFECPSAVLSESNP